MTATVLQLNRFLILMLKVPSTKSVNFSRYLSILFVPVKRKICILWVRCRCRLLFVNVSYFIY